jgi:hypothetical protein
MTRRLSLARIMPAIAVLAIVVAVAGEGRLWLPPAAASGLAGTAGTDTSLPLTNSAATVSGRACPQSADGCGFQDLKITVSQTKNLINQAVSITWTGGRPPTLHGSTNIGGNFLQIFQCWGDDDGTNTANPGPPPEKCEFGGFLSQPGSKAWPPLESPWVTGRTVVSPSDGYVDSSQGLVWKPFHAVDGTIINRDANFSANDPNVSIPGGFWLNPYYNYSTTNEDSVAVSHPDGTGAELFTVDTGLEASGLGCGQSVEALTGGATRIPKCWLVVVPRGTPGEENAAGDTTPYVDTSPLNRSSWQNRIAIPLEFSPVGTQCSIGADERRIAGSELATPAVTSWQPALCATPGSPPYSYSSLSDDLGRQELLSGTPGAPGMAVMTRPIDLGKVDPSNPLVYAPLTLSGVTISFNFERNPALLFNGQSKDPDEAQLARIRVAHINLTPRLVAKLLTESYPSGFTFRPSGPSYAWAKNNADDLVTDKDFLQYNPEFQNLSSGAGSGRLVVEQPTGDPAYEVWRWILADPEATAWLAGSPDPWGARVNPVYSTSATVNPSHVAFGMPIPDSFPKSDPFCYQAGALQNGVVPRPLCMLDISPYVNSMQAAALATRAANDGAKTVEDAGALSPDTVWLSAAPEPLGHRGIFSVTDSASAAQYGLQSASLSRAGDDTLSRAFVQADVQGLTAGERAMVPSATAGVLQGDPATKVPGAYPLTMVTYAATTPRSLDPSSRSDYAAFVTYATGPGQTPGIQFGQLPPGYAPLPGDLQAQAKLAATSIRAGDPAPVTNPPPTTTQKTTVPAGGTTPGTGAGTMTSAATTTGGKPAAPAVSSAGQSRQSVATSSPSGPRTSGNQQSISRVMATPRQGVGFVRFVLPIVVGVGLAALLALLLLDDRPLLHRKTGSSLKRDQQSGPLEGTSA